MFSSITTIEEFNSLIESPFTPGKAEVTEALKRVNTTELCDKILDYMSQKGWRDEIDSAFLHFVRQDMIEQVECCLSYVGVRSIFLDQKRAKEYYSTRLVPDLPSSLVTRRQIPMLRLLFKHGLSPAAPTHKKRTMLFDACRQVDLEIVDLLIEQGTNVEHYDYKARTALHVAVSKGSLEIVDHLLVAGANPSILSLDYKTPISIAVSRADIPIIRRLLEEKVELKSSLITKAVMMGMNNEIDFDRSREIIAILRAAGAPEPTAQDEADILWAHGRVCKMKSLLESSD